MTTPGSGWRGTAETPTGRRVRRGGWLAAAAAVGVAAGLGALLILRPAAAPAVVVVTLAGGVPGAAADHALLTGPGGLPGAGGPPVDPSRDRVRLALEAARGGPAGRPLVAVVTGELARGDDGAAELIAGSAADSARNRLPLTDVLELLKTGRPTLVVLHVAGRTDLVDAALAAVRDEARLALVAAEPPNGVLPAGPSAVARALARGLTSADGFNPEGERDGRVSAAELAGYVRAAVERRAGAGEVCAAVTLRGDGDDFTVGRAGPAPEAAEAPAPGDYPPDLRAAWAGRDERLARGDADQAQRAFADYEAALLAADRRWAAGGGVDAAPARAVAAFDRAVADARPPAARLLPPRPAPADPILVNQFQVAIAAADPPPDPAALPAAVAALAAKPGSAAVFAGLLGADPPARGAAWRWTARALAAADPAGALPETAVAAAWAGADPELAGRVVQARLRLDAAAADPAFVPWAAVALDELHAKLTDAEAHAAAPGFAPPAGPAVAAADALARRVLGAADRFAALRRAYHRAARAGLPAGAGDRARKLLQPPDRPPDLPDLLAAADGWAGATADLDAALAPVERRTGAGAVAAAVRAESAADLDALLASPRLTAPDRATVWAARLLLHARLSAAADERDAAGPPGYADPRRPATAAVAPAPPAAWPDPPAPDWPAVLAWHAGRAAFDATDPADVRSKALTDRAAALAAALPAGPRTPVPLVTAGSPVALAPAAPAARAAVGVRLRDADGPRDAAVSVLRPDDQWVTADPPAGRLSAGPARAAEFAFTISPGPRVAAVPRSTPPLNGGEERARPAGTPPLNGGGQRASSEGTPPLNGGEERARSAEASGVLVRVEVAGRAAFRRVPVDVSALAGQLTVLLRPDAGGSAQDWYVRANGRPASARLVLDNPSNAARTVIVRAFGRESAPVTVPPGGPADVKLGPPPAPPARPGETGAVESGRAAETGAVESGRTVVDLPAEWTVELVEAAGQDDGPADGDRPRPAGRPAQAGRGRPGAGRPGRRGRHAHGDRPVARRPGRGRGAGRTRSSGRRQGRRG